MYPGMQPPQGMSRFGYIEWFEYQVNLNTVLLTTDQGLRAAAPCFLCGSLIIDAEMHAEMHYRQDYV